MKEKLEQYIPTIIYHIDENTLEEVYRKYSKRSYLLIYQQVKNIESKISATSFVEYIIVADFENSNERQHYVREIDNAFQILVSSYPKFISDFKKVAARLINAMNTKDVFNNLLDWQNIAIELLITAKLWHNKGVEIKDIEYDLPNGKSIDLFVKHQEYGELLCEFRSIHISL